MYTNNLESVYAGRKQAYRTLTAIKETALTEPAASGKFRQFIIDAQRDAESNCLPAPDGMHGRETSKGGQNNG